MRYARRGRPALCRSAVAFALCVAAGAAGAQAASAPPNAGTTPTQAAGGGPKAGVQRPQPQPPDELAALLARGGAFSASVEMVRVPVIVVDGSGAFVEHLDQHAFAVRDGGKRHEVEHFVSDVDPVSVGLLVDASAAMQPYEAEVRASVESIARTLRPDDELSLIVYGPRVATLCAPGSDKGAVLAAMADYTTGNGTDRALYDALDSALSTLEDSRYDKRSIIVIGAGGDTASAGGELAVQQHIHRAGVTVHAISLVPRPATGTLASPARVNRLQTLPEIAHFTGGLLAQRPRLTARFGGTAGWLATAGTDVTNYVMHQYVLHYSPQNPPRPGTWREIRVEVTGEHKEVRARSGYIR